MYYVICWVLVCYIYLDLFGDYCHVEFKFFIGIEIIFICYLLKIYKVD